MNFFVFVETFSLPNANFEIMYEKQEILVEERKTKKKKRISNQTTRLDSRN